MVLYVFNPEGKYAQLGGGGGKCPNKKICTGMRKLQKSGITHFPL